MSVLGRLEWWPGSGAILVAFGVGIGVSAGKLWPSTPSSNATHPTRTTAAAFARFETRFQLFWVVGAIVPVVFKIPARLGFFMLAAAAGASAFSYFVGSRNAGRPLVVRPPALQPLEPHDPEPASVDDPDATTVMTAPADDGDPTLLDGGPGSDGRLF